MFFASLYDSLRHPNTKIVEELKKVSYEFRRPIEYKCQWYGSKLTLIDPWYPSSQICSNCGHRQKMPLDKRQ
ncbi:zinc ribbon domain-containing protein, partial [Phormidium pseudopriestleyi]|uniref:zinc ribbon domain-containing protein n=1 Tax=Phormidium pseudopriestleyi TaxID=1759527 RepID=UPI003BF546B7